MEFDHTLDKSIPWRLAYDQVYSYQSNTALLRLADCIKEEVCIEDMLSNQAGPVHLLLPVSYHRRGGDIYHEWVDDLTKEQYLQLNKSFEEVFSSLQKDNGFDYWYSLIDMTEDDVLKKTVEIELLLYNHPVNQERRSMQQVEISGLSIAPAVMRRNWIKRKLYTNNEIISRACHGSGNLADWLKSPVSGVTIVLGREVGALVFQALQDTLVQMLESNACKRLRWISPDYMVVYTTNHFQSLLSKLAFRKQVI